MGCAACIRVNHPELPPSMRNMHKVARLSLTICSASKSHSTTTYKLFPLNPEVLLGNVTFTLEARQNDIQQVYIRLKNSPTPILLLWDIPRIVAYQCNNTIVYKACLTNSYLPNIPTNHTLEINEDTWLSVI
jgi:hypothetical protein